MPEGFSSDALRVLIDDYVIPGIHHEVSRGTPLEVVLGRAERCIVEHGGTVSSNYLRNSLSDSERNRLTNNSGCGIMPNSREVRRSTMPNMQEEWRWFTELRIGPETVHGTRVKMLRNDLTKMSVLIEDPADVIEWIWVANDYGAYIADPSDTWRYAIEFICQHAHLDRMEAQDEECEEALAGMPAGTRQLDCVPEQPTPMPPPQMPPSIPQSPQAGQAGQLDGYARMAIGYAGSTTTGTSTWTIDDAFDDALSNALR